MQIESISFNLHTFLKYRFEFPPTSVGGYNNHITLSGFNQNIVSTKVDLFLLFYCPLAKASGN